jgi:hypothetical protein
LVEKREGVGDGKAHGMTFGVQAVGRFQPLNL